MAINGTGQCRVQRQKGAEEQGGQAGKWRRQSAKMAQADVHPGDAAEKQAQAESAADERAAPLAGSGFGAAVQQVEEPA